MSNTPLTTNRTDGSTIALTGNVTWVDAVYGSDTRGKPHRQDLPFATLAAAGAAARVGDLIHVMPGTYDEIDWIVSGVDYYFEDGAIVEYTGAADASLISDGADGYGAELVVNIYGMGVFRHSGSITTALNATATINVSDTDTVLYIEAKEIDNEVASDQSEAAIKQSNGVLEVRCPNIHSDNTTPAIAMSGGTSKIGAPIFYFDAAPVDGGSGTYVNVAVPGSLLVDMVAAKLYINTGTQASPTWTLVGGAATLNGVNVATVADANVIGGVPVLFRINVADASGDTDVTVTHKVRVLDAWGVNTGIAAHAADDTWQVKNAANAITDAVAKTATVNAVKRISTIDPTYHEIAAGGTLRVTAAKSTNAAVTVYVLAIRVA